MSSSNRCFLTCIRISQEAGQVVWYFHLFQNFPQFVVIHTVKGFGIVNKAEVDVFLELSCFFDDPTDVGNLTSCPSAFSKSSLNIWRFTVHISLKPGLENFEHHFASVWNECNCAVVWAFFCIAFLWNWNENWLFHDPDNHDDVITNLEPDILECEVKWALEIITTNKASGGDGIPVELFQILKDDAVKVLHSICQQIWKTQQWPQDRNGVRVRVYNPSPLCCPMTFSSPL